MAGPGVSRKIPRKKGPPALGSCGPGKLTEKGKFPKVLRGGCKRCFGPREQRSTKSLLHHPKLLLHRCKLGFGWCKRLFGDLCSLGPKHLLHPPLSTFGNFPFSVNFPGPQLPNPSPKFWNPQKIPGKSHPWTNTSVGGNFRKTFRTIGPCDFPQEKVWTNDWSI